jgi:hypothetical protein
LPEPERRPYGYIDVAALPARHHLVTASNHRCTAILLPRAQGEPHRSQPPLLTTVDMAGITKVKSMPRSAKTGVGSSFAHTHTRTITFAPSHGLTEPYRLGNATTVATLRACPPWPEHDHGETDSCWLKTLEIIEEGPTGSPRQGTHRVHQGGEEEPPRKPFVAAMPTAACTGARPGNRGGAGELPLTQPWTRALPRR